MSQIFPEFPKIVASIKGMDKVRKRRAAGHNLGHFSNARPCLINDKIFRFSKEAASYVGVDVAIIKDRCNSPDFPNYQWIVFTSD